MALVSKARRIRLCHGEELFPSGDAGYGLYCVLAGAVLLSNVNKEGKVAVLAQVEPVQWFGEASVIDRGPREFTAHASGKTDVLCVEGAALERWLNNHPAHWRNVATLASNRLRRALEAIQDAAFLSLEQRILKRLEQIANSSIGQQTKVRVPQEVLAHMMGVSRQSTNRALRLLDQRGLISRNYGLVELHRAYPRLQTGKTPQG